MVIRMRSTRAHTANRRSHHALSAPAISKEGDGKVLHLRHRASAVSGTYKGRQIKSLQKKIERNLRRAETKAKLKTKKS